jgi:hypothetical protein
MIELNYRDRSSDTDKYLKHWEKRPLTVLGRFCILNSLILPKLNNLFFAIPNPDSTFMHTLQVVCFNCMWHANKGRINRKQIMSDYCDGGIRMSNIANFIDSIQILWIRRLMQNNPPLNTLFRSTLPATSVDNFKCRKQSKYSILEKNLLQAKSELLWYNDNICIGGKPIMYTHWLYKGVVFINDLFTEENQCFTFDRKSPHCTIQSN